MKLIVAYNVLTWIPVDTETGEITGPARIHALTENLELFQPVAVLYEDPEDGEDSDLDAMDQAKAVRIARIGEVPGFVLGDGELLSPTTS
jgi:hypothetical protein